ncbi:hypothetical protein DFA_09225 [Cavenderia fasciculata]|uniref:Uncharacterized protein n=1 Tax=Cavenderia fasciculata TaxID=261658 RepID=F4Q715_CACFS|nr:uncharacterized protein DFA_09225 [Cavenderia fasciculata]EGG16197.1 hypothetical protein DFA_09225 [Cavenderia fasciculata]|eukprot:XP_004354581.1 hypothetical protein DFA_09225 [Cavenderia fasciculata]
MSIKHQMSKVEQLKKQLEEAQREESMKKAAEISQLGYYGSSNDNFSCRVLKQMISKCNSKQAINGIKKYILTYFLTSTTITIPRVFDNLFN